MIANKFAARTPVGSFKKSEDPMGNLLYHGLGQLLVISSRRDEQKSQGLLAPSGVGEVYGIGTYRHAPVIGHGMCSLQTSFG